MHAAKHATIASFKPKNRISFCKWRIMHYHLTESLASGAK